MRIFSEIIIIECRAERDVFSSVTQSSLTLCDAMDCSTPGFPVHHQLPELAQTHVHCSVDMIGGHGSVMPSNYLILCYPLLLLPSIFPSIRIFYNELVLLSRWPHYWSFSFSISPSNEYSGLISFRIAFGFISLQSKGLSRLLSNTTVQKYHFFGVQLSLWSNSHIHT